ncbi:hypothetical protein LJB99_01630 [Deltaproteobacteria bacterium OttesenSCG-928-K17]|nr:hypothetical protein [Deltaproteobacteria bacterium OttesenSCG-928-K17]
MFKKFAQLENRAERLELFNLLKLNLQILLKLAELLTLVILASGPAWRLGAALAEAAGPAAGPALAIIIMMLIFGLVRLPFICCLRHLNASFGLDPRPTEKFLKQFLGCETRLGGLGLVVSLVLFWGLTVTNLWLWTIFAVIIGAVLILAYTLRPELIKPLTLRPPSPGEMDADFLARIDKWSDKTGLSSLDVCIGTDYFPGLKRPGLIGLGRRSKLIIPEKCLISFRPRQLNILVTAAIVEALAKAPEKIMLLRFSAIAVAAPLAGILISLVGTGLWGYPARYSPALMTQIWLAGWISFNLAEMSIRMTRRSIETQAAAVAAMLLKDGEALEEALAILAERNLEEESPSAITGFFSPHYDRKRFMKHVRQHQHMAMFKDED